MAIALHEAVKDVDEAEVRRLLKAGDCDVNARCEEQTPLHRTCKSEVVASRNADRQALAALLIAHGADVNAHDRYNRTVLHRASHQGRTDLVRFLIENGADVNGLDVSGWSPLLLAAVRGYGKTVEVLVDNGAEMNDASCALPVWKNRTPLAAATHRGRIDVARTLVKRGASLSTTPDTPTSGDVSRFC